MLNENTRCRIPNEGTDPRSLSLPSLHSVLSFILLASHPSREVCFFLAFLSLFMHMHWCPTNKHHPSSLSSLSSSSSSPSLFSLLSPEQFCSLISASSWCHLCSIWESMKGVQLDSVGFGQTRFSWSCFLSAMSTKKKKAHVYLLLRAVIQTQHPDYHS